MIAAMQSLCRDIRVPRSRPWPVIALPVDGLRHRAPRAVLLTLMLLVSACSNGTSAVSSLATGADRLASDKSPAALLRIADATRAGGDPANAIGLYRRAHELAPQDPAPLARLGASFAEMQSYTEAVEAYRQAQALAPQDPEVQRGLGAVLLALGEPQLALSQLTEALAREKNEPRLYNLVGVAYDQLGRHDLAQETYLTGLREAPNNRPLRNNLGLSQALSGDFAAAAATLSEAASGPKSSPRARQNLALVYGLAGDTDKAAVIARSDLDEASVKNNLAYYALLRGMDDRARAAAIIGGRMPADGPAVAEPSRPEPQSGDIPAAPAKPPAVITTPLPLPTGPESQADSASAPAAPPKSPRRRTATAAKHTQDAAAPAVTAPEPHAAATPASPAIPAPEPQAAETPAPPAAATVPDAVAPIAARRAPAAAPASPDSGTHDDGASTPPREEMTTTGI
jgi:Flp pilus assembly protein TadD